MKGFDPYTIPLQGGNLIEASAGTGKTYTIAALYLRLVLELGLPVEKILVVTYTKAATAELRERIRRGLAEAQDSLNGPEAGLRDPLFAKIDQEIDRSLAVRRLRHALLGFDRAAIFTIHGFCQRALADRAFESATAFECEMVTDQSLLLQQIVDDFWRLHIQQLPAGLLDHLMGQGITPDTLNAQLQGYLGKPYLQLRAPLMPVGLEGLEADYLECFGRARELWRRESDEIGTMLLNNTGLNGNRYRKSSLPGWLAAMSTFLGDAPGPCFDQFPKFSSDQLAQGVKKGGVAPQHRFFELCTELLRARDSLQRAYGDARAALLRALLEYANAELLLRKRDRRIQYYDDLLINLQSALISGNGEAMAQALRSDYRAALIDEFQDTDPVQYGIFRRIFRHDGMPLFLVGDPKQAIYSFRGADIFTYLQAARECDSQYTLEYNWRSVPALVTSINRLFKQSDNSFIYSDLSFYPSTPAAAPRTQLNGDTEICGALRFELLEGEYKREQAQAQVVEAVAAEVSRLLVSAQRGALKLGDRPLIGGDIALLVRTHAQGARLKQALLSLGIASVQQSQANVFHSEMAQQLERLLAALAEPGREGLVRAALAGDILGFDGNRLAGLDETELESELIAFRLYHRLWRESGFMQMFRRLSGDKEVAVRLLGFDDGERRLTDLLHLAELLHQQERDGRVGLIQLRNWFARQRQAPVAESETSQLRLESDGNLVQIVTIHKSKGLEYPVVFVPFGWEPGVRRIHKESVYTFHDSGKGMQPVLELGSERWEKDRTQAEREMLAESLRLLYVAVTRACCRCYLYWGKVDGAEYSPLAWLLHASAGSVDDADLLSAIKRDFRKLDPAAIKARISSLAEMSEGTISLHRCSGDAGSIDARPVLAGQAPPALRARPFLRRMDGTRRITSFSALTGAHASVELPDHEFHERMPVAAPIVPQRHDIYAFPRGARAGSCLHAIFERIDFAQLERASLESLVISQLAQYGIEKEWSGVVCDMVERVVAAPLDRQGGIRLQRVSADRRLVEMEFHYPLKAIDTEGLTAILRSAPSLDGTLSAPLDFPRIEGFMKGFIDLVFELDGLFYLADYKSNWLGETPEEYRQERLAESMAGAGYHLQYLLYTLALHRYLRQRIPDYRYRQHFGGAYYLYLRGMDPAAPDGTGVFFARPEEELVDALDRYFGAPEALS